MIEKNIYKYKLETTNVQSINLPKGSEILTLQIQYDDPCLWILVDPKEEKEWRTFEIFGTGHPVPYDMGIERKYIGSYQLHNGVFVGHVFERIN